MTIASHLPPSILPQIPYRLRLAFDALTGRLDRSAENLAGRINWSDWKPGRKTILCLKRSSFIVDVGEMRRRLDYNFVEVSAARIKLHQEPWISPAFRLQTFFYELLQTDLIWEREKLARFGKAFLRAAMRAHPVDAVLAGNTDYWQDEAIKLGCKELGIPFLVLGRENYSVEIAANHVRERFGISSFRFNGAGVAVYSRITQVVMDESGCFPPGAVWTTGAPRFDAWHGVRSLPHAERDLVLLLSYADPAYLCPGNFREMLPIFVEEAKKHKEVARFAIKVKKGAHIDDLLVEFPYLREAPVELILDEPLQKLFPRARVIIGANSHAIIESLLLDNPLIVPWWADGALPRSDSILCADDPADAAVAYFPRSGEAFREMLMAGIENRLERLGSAEQRRARFSEHVAIPADGSPITNAVGQFLDHFVRG